MATTSTFQVSLTANDGNWIYNEFFEEFGFSNTECKLNTDNISQKVFLLFNNVTIPKGATILSAQLQIYPTAKSGFPTIISYSFQTVDNAVAPTTYNEAQSYSSIATTPITDSFADSEIVLSSWLNSKTTNMSSSLQQITSRTGWNYGNSILMFLTADAGLTLNDYTTSGTYAAKLVVTYTGVEVNLQVGAVANDGFWATAADYFDSSMGYAGADSFSAYIAFNLFTNVQIPRGAKITSASFKFRTSNDNVITVAAKTKVAFQATDNATAPTTTAQANSKYSTITTAVTKDYASAANYTWYTYDDISVALQEIVNRAGWASGNSILLFFADNGSLRTSSNYLSQVNYTAGVPTNGAKLDVTYTMDGYFNDYGNLILYRDGAEVTSYTGTGSGQSNMYKDSTSGDFIINIKGEEVERFTET